MQLLIALMVFGVTVLQPSPFLRATPSDPVLVRAVTDGRTITVRGYGRVRLLGIDTPPAVAWRARQRLTDLALAHWVRLEFDGSGATKGAYVIREDGLFVNAVLVREGIARVAGNAPSTRRDELIRAEQEARTFRLGLWVSGESAAATGYTSRGKKSSARNP